MAVGEGLIGGEQPGTDRGLPPSAMYGRPITGYLEAWGNKGCHREVRALSRQLLSNPTPSARGWPS